MFSKKFVFGLLLSGSLIADDGMWLFDHLPKEQVQKMYGFVTTNDFLQPLERASVRFNNGGTGSFVSPRGLLFTNHHVGATVGSGQFRRFNNSGNCS